MSLPRRLAQLGGTTTRGDAVAALRLSTRSAGLVDGPALQQYEAELARRTGAEHAISFAAGRVALYGLLRTMGVGRGDEVIVPLPTHIVVTNAVRYTGATPVYADCRLDDFNLDPEAAAAAATPRTRAMLVQHSFGIPADLDRLIALADERGFAVIEDCVHALGATWRGRPVGAIAGAGFFSTEETKIISSTMGGAAVLSNSELLGPMRDFQAACPPPSRALTRRRLAKLAVYHPLTEPRLHTVTRPAYELFGGRNPLPVPTSPEELAGERPAEYEQRFAAGLAEIATRQLQRLDDNLTHRRRTAALYAERLSELGFPAPRVAPGDEPAWVRYPVRVADRAAAIRALRRRVVPGTWFSSVQEEAVRPTINGYVEGSCPRAERAGRELVNLPTHPRVTDDDVDALVEIMRRIEPADA